jgi:hypothetical protein
MLRAATVLFRLGNERIDTNSHLELTATAGTFEVIDVWCGRMAEIPAMLTESAHDAVCRTFSGVVARLGSEAGRPVGPAETVTALVLRPIESNLLIARKVP